MRITVEFENMDEFEQFRVSGKASRRKKDDINEAPTAEEVSEKQAAMAQSIRDAQPISPQPPPVQGGFPGGNGIAPPPAAVHPLVTAILARIDGAVNSGQSTDAIVTWFRQQIGPDAANATLDQIRQVFVPRMSDTQLKQLAPTLGIVLQ